MIYSLRYQHFVLSYIFYRGYKKQNKRGPKRHKYKQKTIYFHIYASLFSSASKLVLVLKVTIPRNMLSLSVRASTLCVIEMTEANNLKQNILHLGEAIL